MDNDQNRNSHCCTSIGLLCVSLTGEWDIVHFYLCVTFIPAPFSLLPFSRVTTPSTKGENDNDILYRSTSSIYMVHDPRTKD